ncbi:MAG: hypothetical protein LBE75_09025 [Burkholderiales bacterium]|nr:hypothetical protein [Burkholderiales bacterium]
MLRTGVFSNYGQAVLISVLTLVICGMRGGGLLLWLLFFFFMLWLLSRVIAIFRKKDSVKRVAIVTGIWLGCAVVVVVLHLGYAKTARQKADEALAHISAFHVEHGRYPKDLQESGFVQAPRPNKDDITYFYEDGKDDPSLFYPNTFAAFFVNTYDFKAQTWSTKD